MAHLPETGALLDQPAWLMEAFSIVALEWAKARSQ